MNRNLTVPFSALSTWSPRQYTSSGWDWPEEDLQPLALALARKHQAVDKQSDDAVTVSIDFRGEMTPRGVSLESLSGNLYAADVGDLVYSKIDVRNGAIGVVPAELGRAAVTSEFPVYTINSAIADPTYVTLLLRSPAFKKILSSIASGATGRKRITEAQLESIKVPLPSLGWQRNLVARWHQSHTSSRAADEAVASVVASLDAYLRSASTPEAISILDGRSMTATAGALDRWDVASHKSAMYRRLQPNLVYLSSIAEEATVTVRPAADPDHVWPVYGVSNRAGVFLRHMQAGRYFNSAYKAIRPGWFFHNPTRSAVGSLGRVPLSVPPDAITSPEYQVWRARRDEDAAFLDLLLRTDYFIKLVRLNRSGGVKQRLYVSDLLSIGVPSIDPAARAALTEDYANAVAARQLAKIELSDTETTIWNEIQGPGA